MVNIEETHKCNMKKKLYNQQGFYGQYIICSKRERERERWLRQNKVSILTMKNKNKEKERRRVVLHGQ
jgi:hypothetical protein